MKCKYCKRLLPNKSFITKNGCIWCDWTYYRTQKEEQKLLDIMQKLRKEL